MKGTKVASRYAKALLDIVIETNNIEKVTNDIQFFLSTYNEEDAFRKFVENPVIVSVKKMEIFNLLFKQFDPLTLSFIELITKNRREAILSEIAKSYNEQLKKHKGIVSITLSSATKIDDSVKTNLMNKVNQIITGTIDLEEKIDPELIGGFKVRIGDLQIDASVSNKIENLKQQLTN